VSDPQPTIRWKPGKPLGVRRVGEDAARVDEGREPSAWMGDAMWTGFTIQEVGLYGFVGAFAAITIIALSFAVSIAIWAVVSAVAILVVSAIAVIRTKRRRQ
jgi:hypothetical protein